MSNETDNTSINWLCEQLSKGALSRREFISRAMSLGLTVALASSLASKAVLAGAGGPGQGGANASDDNSGKGGGTGAPFDRLHRPQTSCFPAWRASPSRGD